MGYPVRGDPFIHVIYRRQKSDEIVQKNIMDFASNNAR